MCINVAFPGDFWINNQGQKLAGNGIFVSSVKNVKRIANHDDPLPLNICRLHFEKRHNGEWGEIPQVFFATAPRYLCGCSTENDEDILAYRQAIMSDTPIGRGYWKSLPAENFYIPMEGNSLLPKKGIEFCTKGQWAFILRSSYNHNRQKVENRGSISLGGWEKDSFGCYLSYAIPVGAPIELVGRISSGVDEVGSLGVKIPWGTEWAVWIRCSDTGAHSGFTIVRLVWRENWVFWHPILASLFSAPHVFPAYESFLDFMPKEVPNFGRDFNAAIKLVEHIVTYGFAILNLKGYSGILTEKDDYITKK